jgi:hypothetical protein
VISALSVPQLYSYNASSLAAEKKFLVEFRDSRLIEQEITRDPLPGDDWWKLRILVRVQR